MENGQGAYTNESLLSPNLETSSLVPNNHTVLDYVSIKVISRPFGNIMYESKHNNNKTADAKLFCRFESKGVRVERIIEKLMLLKYITFQ